MDWTESEVRKWLSNAGWTENEGFWWHPATDPSGRNENDLPAILASFASEVERLTLERAADKVRTFYGNQRYDALDIAREVSELRAVASSQGGE